jgi:hypothetical protein
MRRRPADLASIRSAHNHNWIIVKETKAHRHEPLNRIMKYGDISMDKKAQTELEAAAFRRLVDHFRERSDVQNIDMMNIAGFCRNCLSKWYLAAAEEKGLELDYEGAREIVYGMPYGEWKDKYQSEASPEQIAEFKKSLPD